MRRFMLAFTVLIAMFVSATVGSALVSAQGATLTITPSSAAGGSNFSISANGLAANSTYTFDFLLASNNSVIFSTERTTDANGAVTLSIRSDTTDIVGEYIVQAKQGATVEAEGRFTITDGSTEPATPQGQSTLAPATLAPIEPTVAPTSAPVSGSVTVTVEPAEGQLRDTFRISISGLTARADVFVTVREAATSLVVYDREWTADANGEVSVELFTTVDTPAGQYNVDVSDSGGALIGSGSFMLNGLSGRDATFTITPIAGAAGTTFAFAIANGEAFADLTFTVLDPDTGTIIFETIARTNVDGVVSVDFAGADLAEKTYPVQVSDSDGTIAEGSLTIGDAVSPDPLSIRISPTEAPIGSVFSISANGLTPNSTATIRILKDGTEVASFDQNVNRRGSTGVTFSNSDADALGEYTAEIVMNGAVIISDTFTVLEALPEVTPTPEPTEAPATSAAMVVEPAVGPQGTEHNITVTGLSADATVTFNVLLDGATVLTLDKTADASGVAMLVLTTNATDAVGSVYTIDAIVDGAIAATGILEVTEGGSTTTPTTGVNILITPSSGTIGTSHLVEVNGLEANQAITLVVFLDGQEQYRTERVADANGAFSMRLKADVDDVLGTYNVQIQGADNAVLVEAPLRITTTALATPGIEGAIPATPNEISSEVIEDNLNGDELTFIYDLNGTGGQLLRVTVNSSDFDTYLSVTDSSGYEVSYNDDYNADMGTDSQISALILPYDDTYTIQVTSYANYNAAEGETTGDFTLTLDTITPSELVVGQPLSVAFGDSDAQYFSIDVLDGDVLTFVGVGSDLDTQIEVFDPSGFSTYDDDGGTGYDPEIMSYTATVSGIYIVKFSTYEANIVGEAILSVEQAAVNSLNEGARNISLNSKANTSTLTFEGVEGSVATLNLVFQGGTSGDVTVEALQDGNTLMTFSSNYSVLPELSLPVAVLNSGIVRVVVSTTSGTSQYEVSVGQ